MTAPIYEVLVGIASENHGYVTTRQATQNGVDPAQLKLLAKRGRLERVAHGVYRVTALPRTAWDEFALAVAWSGGKGVISHESALVMHGLSDVNPSLIHMLVPADSYPRSRGAELYRLHRTRVFDGNDLTEVEGIPVTTVVRTIKDCMATGSDPYQLHRAIEQGRSVGSIPRTTADYLANQLERRGGAQ